MLNYTGVLLLPEGEGRRRKAASLLPVHWTLWIVLFKKWKLKKNPPLIVMCIQKEVQMYSGILDLGLVLLFFVCLLVPQFSADLALPVEFDCSSDNLKVVTHVPGRLADIFHHPSVVNYLLKIASTEIWTDSITTHNNRFHFNKMTFAKNT